jgi:hypothetical protein
MKEFFTSQFLFQINRIQIQPVDKVFLMVGVAALAMAVIFKLAARFAPSPVDAAYRNNFFKIFLFLGSLEALWYGARAQLVRFFGTHFVALSIILISAVWLLVVLWKMFRRYRAEKTAWEKEQVRRKYLPN